MSRETDAHSLSRRSLIARSGATAAGMAIATTGIAPELVGAAPAAQSTKDTAIFPIIANPGTLNPIQIASTAELQVATTIHDSLVRLDPFTFEPKPQLAESWTVSEDGLTWTFKLRAGVKWHDGTEFTAEDVKFTTDKMLDPAVNSARGRQFALITETRVVDPLTVEFVVASPWAALPVIIAGRWTAAPKHILESVDLATDTTYSTNPVGVGPYKFVEWVASDHVTLEANPDYFLGAPKIPKIVFKVLPDSNVQIVQLRNGEIDAIPFFADASISSVQGQSGLVVDQGWGSIWYAVHLNMNRANLFGDQKVRQALSYAIDRDALIQNLLQGVGQVATGPIIPAIEWAYNPNVKTYPYEPETAKQLLRDAGWAEVDGGWEKDGTRLAFKLSSFRGNATVEQSTVLVQQYFSDIGVEAEIEILEFGTFVTEVRDNRTPEGYYSFISYMTPEPEPDGNYAYFHSSNAERGSNFTAYNNPEVDQLLDAGRAESDQAARQATYFRLQEILAEDMTRIFLFYPPSNLVRHSYLKGLPAVNSYYHIADAYFEFE
jgi:peptide/nickel transport system substrate-binding protein